MNKIPAVTPSFWMLQLCAASLADTVSGLLSQKLHLNITESLLLVAGIFAAAAAGQVASRKLYLPLFWVVMLCTAATGAALQGWLQDAMHMSYVKDALILAAVMAGVFFIWLGLGHNTALQAIQGHRTEALFWSAALAAAAFGSALGDCLEHETPLGAIGAPAVSAALVLFSGILARFTKAPRTVLFWIAVTSIQPLGQALGMFLVRGHDENGMGFGAITASALLAYLMFALVVIVMRRQKQPRAETPGI